MKPREYSGRERGVVMVEALIVIGMLAVMLIAGSFLHAMYVHKLATERQARAEAWRQGSKGCSGGLSGNLFATAGSFITAFQGDSFDESAPGFGVGSSLKSNTSDVTVPPLFGGGNRALRSEIRVACNEVNPPESDVIGLFQWAFGELVP